VGCCWSATRTPLRPHYGHFQEDGPTAAAHDATSHRQHHLVSRVRSGPAKRPYGAQCYITVNWPSCWSVAYTPESRRHGTAKGMGRQIDQRRDGRRGLRACREVRGAAARRLALHSASPATEESGTPQMTTNLVTPFRLSNRADLLVVQHLM
jgi:hypothetical protein